MPVRRLLAIRSVSCLAAGLILGLTPGATLAAGPPGFPPAFGGERQPASAAELVSVTMGADVDRITPGSTFHLTFRFEIESHWHVYWRFAGSSGMPTTIEVEAPRGFRVGDIIWPRPSTFPSELGPTYGYEKEVVLQMPVTVGADVAPGEKTLKAFVDFLVCKEACLLGSMEKSLTVSVAGADAAPATPDASAAAWRNRAPVLIEKQRNVRARIADGVVRIEGVLGDHATAGFIPVETPGVTYGRVRIETDTAAGRFVIEAPYTLNAANALGEPMRVGGLVTLGTKPTDPSVWVSAEASTLPAAWPTRR